MTEPRYPEIVVELTGQDGDAFNVLGLVLRALRAAGVDNAEIGEFCHEATAGDYEHLVLVHAVGHRCSRWPRAR